MSNMLTIPSYPKLLHQYPLLEGIPITYTNTATVTATLPAQTLTSQKFKNLFEVVPLFVVNSSGLVGFATLSSLGPNTNQFTAQFWSAPGTGVSVAAGVTLTATVIVALNGAK